ncbi:TetR/AcrR family transcriptional regulator [Pseudonocardia humida]|uniref:TetR/AcrR family transcriptional regulator n=1 Tax=Pseudonocardia humida TaxID=2800819 RepID=A0ABT1A0W8_9PSEU|nr:TetR/AcrR family transcriptional regulator [Pseudonocardia humida]MCO1656583.1 TetR/AcrR family transcriptional regulator [Pseudonocardia humida]
MPPAPLRADAARNRERVLAAARAAVIAGDASLPLNEIARRAGVGVGTVYRHFPTRQALLEAVTDEPLALLLAEVRAAAADPDPGGGFARLVRAAGRIEIDNVGFAEVLTGDDPAAAATAAKRAELIAVAERVLERARAAGVVRADVTAGDVQRLVCGIGHAARLGGADPHERAELYTELLLAGLRP